MKRILYLTSRLPYPLYRGDKYRAYNHIKYLSEHHHIYLLAFIQSEEEHHYIPQLKKYCRDVQVVLLRPIQSYWNVIRFLFSSKPAQTSYYYSRKMMDKVGRVITSEKIDLLQVHTIRMSPYGEEQTIPKVIDIVDSFSLWLKRRVKVGFSWKIPFYFLEYLKVKRYEKKVIASYDQALIISEHDRRSVNAGEDVVILSNGVDVIPEEEPYHRVKSNPHMQLIFTGNMSYYPNIDAVRYFGSHIWPALKKEYKDLRFLIVGADPGRAVRKLNGNGVLVTGYVEDIHTVLKGADIYVAPIRLGSGIKYKVLEAFRARLPVVTTDIGKEGIYAEPQRAIMVANTPREFIDSVRALLEDSELRRSLGQTGYDFLTKHYQWDNRIEKLRMIYERLFREK